MQGRRPRFGFRQPLRGVGGGVVRTNFAKQSVVSALPREGLATTPGYGAALGSATPCPASTTTQPQPTDPRPGKPAYGPFLAMG